MKTEFQRGWSPPESGGSGRGARVLRGASWNNDNEDNLRSSNRNNDQPTNRNHNVGFRVVVGAASARKVSNGINGEEPVGEGPGGRVPSGSPNPAQRAPHGEKTRRRAVAGRAVAPESHGPPTPPGSAGILPAAVSVRVRARELARPPRPPNACRRGRTASTWRRCPTAPHPLLPAREARAGERRGGPAWVGSQSNCPAPAVGGTTAWGVAPGSLAALAGLLAPALSSIPNGGEGVNRAAFVPATRWRGPASPPRPLLPPVSRPRHFNSGAGEFSGSLTNPPPCGRFRRFFGRQSAIVGR